MRQAFDRWDSPMAGGHPPLICSSLRKHRNLSLEQGLPRKCWSQAELPKTELFPSLGCYAGPRAIKADRADQTTVYDQRKRQK